MARPGGSYLEDQGGCDEADYSRSGRATAASIASALDYMRGQAFIRPDGAVMIGHSAGGWGALALAGETRRASRPSSRSHPAAAVTPMMFPTRSARRTR